MNSHSILSPFLAVPILSTADDYPRWRHSVRIVCKSKEVWQYVLGQVAQLEPDTDHFEEWSRRNDKALTILQGFLAPNLIQFVVHTESAATTLEILDAHIRDESLSSKVFVRKPFSDPPRTKHVLPGLNSRNTTPGKPVGYDELSGGTN